MTDIQNKSQNGNTIDKIFKKSSNFGIFLVKQIYIPVIVFLGVLILLNYVKSIDQYWNLIEPLITFVTLCVAILFTSMQYRKRWEDSLPKYMNVKFVHADEPHKVLMEENNVYLSSESDIRAWGQSIGQQLNDGKRLFFDRKKLSVKNLINKNDQGEIRNIYEVVFYLTKIPETIKKTLVQKINPNSKWSITKEIDLSELYDTEPAKLDNIVIYLEKAASLAGEGNEVILTGRAPVWLYLAVAHALHGKARKLIYNSPASGHVVIFDHDPF